MNEIQIRDIIEMYNAYLNFEYAQSGLDEQDVNEFIKYYNEFIKYYNEIKK
jgi:hypothetical protein